MQSTYAKVHGSVSVNALHRKKQKNQFGVKCTTWRSKTLPEPSLHDCETSSMIVAFHEAFL